MIIFLAFVRTVSVALLCLFGGVAIYGLLIWLGNLIGLSPNSESKGWIDFICLTGAWACYRLFFRQAWRKEGNEWIQE